MSAADLGIQPRINSESLSQAFEQSLVAENDFSMDAAPHEAASMPVGNKRRPAVVSKLGFEHTDPDDDADSWLIPSPGPPSGHKFEMSPPKEGQSAKTGSFLRKTPSARENSSQEANGGAAVRRAPGPPSQRASKIPRVASLGGTRNTSKSTVQQTAKALAPALSPRNAKASNNKFIGLRKKPETPANGASTAATDAPTGTVATAKAPSARQSKAMMNSEQAINAKREDAASSRIPSRPGTASFTRPAAIPTPTKAATAVSRPTAAASKSGPAGGKSSTAASRPTVAAAAAKRAATQQTGARRVGKIGGRATDAGNAATANGPVPLLSAVSGPEEELAMAAQAAVEEESQPAAPQQETAQPGPFPKHEDRPNGTAGVDPLPPLQTEPPAKKEAPLSKTKSTGSNGEGPGHSARVSRQTTPRPDWVDVVPPPPEQEPQEECEVPADKAADARRAEAGLHVSDSSVSKKSLHKMPSTPFANQQGESKAVTDDKQQEESRPGVGRKKAADLPDAGYSKPTHQQKGCCGCVVM